VQNYNGAVDDPRIQLLDSQLFQSLVDCAYHSPRLRTNHNFHLSLDDNPHRFLNVMVKGTYIAPHRHRSPPKSESFLVLDGELAFFTFDDSGQVTGTHVLGRKVVNRYSAGPVAHLSGPDSARSLLRSEAGTLLGQ